MGSTHHQSQRQPLQPVIYTVPAVVDGLDELDSPPSYSLHAYHTSSYLQSIQGPTSSSTAADDTQFLRAPHPDQNAQNQHYQRVPPMTLSVLDRGQRANDLRGYRIQEPMTSTEIHHKRYDEPGCCGSDTGGCCFSSHGACCFSDHDACCFSDHEACCFSDHRGCCFSDNGGCCFSDGRHSTPGI
ncbi:uncharacterized protein B0I36DRAFT_144164 [Microdochium trichocladiopsis]|uniref:Uncharacterized protein n=1 Tax=Microdochium trichocladiopsis TaxID=1682393 RepID=A0A9P8Y576_9PEZI|nr:uncharacterized protein B0I36DRAFT_144164 [Microdochium trichocladiopsis]KAH7027845.1 hypothetical protein B0I36DRAFT_144164 [Microdochium trichocladiopsis]